MAFEEYQEWFTRIRAISQDFNSDYPPSSDSVQIFGPKPVSLRSNRAYKDVIEESIKVQTRVIPWVCTEDIGIVIEWKINDRERYENPGTPDIDNILKPILDSLCGPEGVLVDDCQVVSLSVTCLGGWVHGSNSFDLKLTLPNEGMYENNACIPKDEIQMVNIGKNLYLPINKRLETEKGLVDRYCHWVETKTEDLAEEGSLPIRRFFHKGRVGVFETIEASDL